MSEQKKYTVMELAESVGVPRTTINDWLSRYSQFIDFRAQGKRKVYTGATVSVLQEICGLRNQGLSSFEIEEELVKRHPVHGEVTDQTRPAAPPGAPHPRPKEAAGQLILRNQMTELGEMIRNSMLDMNRRIGELETSNTQTVSKANRWYLFTLLLLLILFVTGLIASLKIEKYLKKNRNLKLTNQQVNHNLSQREDDLKEKNDDLKKEQINNTHLENQLGQLENSLKKQSKEFERTMDEMQQEAETSKTAAILAQRNKFASGRLDLLKQLDDARDSRQQLQVLLQQLQQQTYDQNQIIRNLTVKPAEELPPEPEIQKNK